MKKDQMAYDLQAGAMAVDYSGDVSIDRSAMAATCTFSTPAVDRVGDIVDMAGIHTENHRRNPVIMWAHGKTFDKPIGRTVDPAGRYTVYIDDVARQTTYFSQTLLEAEQIFDLVCEGIICTNSIGFDTIKAQPIYTGGRKGGLHILECDLLEVSWTAVPINPEACTKAIHSLCCGRPLAPSIRGALEPYSLRRNAWANGATIEKCFDVRAMLLKSADFEESKHPRADDGKFGSGHGSASDKPSGGPGSARPKPDAPKVSQGEIDEVSRYLDMGEYTRQDAIDYFVDQEVPLAEATSMVDDLLAGDEEEPASEPVKLSQAEIDEVGNYLSNGNYTPEEATEYLVEQGLTQEAATQMVTELTDNPDEPDEATPEAKAREEQFAKTPRGKVEVSRGKEDAVRTSARDQEDAELSGRRDETTARHEAEIAEIDTQLEAIDTTRDELASAREDEDTELQADHDAEDEADTEIDEGRDQADSMRDHERKIEDTETAKARDKQRSELDADTIAELESGDWYDEDEATAEKRDKEDEKTDAAREKEDAKRDKEREKREAAREKEDEKRDAAREKEDGKLDKAQEKLEAHKEKREAKHQEEIDALDDEESTLQEARDDEDGDIEAERDEEDADIEASEEAEDEKVTAFIDNLSESDESHDEQLQAVHDYNAAAAEAGERTRIIWFEAPEPPPGKQSAVQSQWASQYVDALTDEQMMDFHPKKDTSKV